MNAPFNGSVQLGMLLGQRGGDDSLKGVLVPFGADLPASCDGFGGKSFLRNFAGNTPGSQAIPGSVNSTAAC